MRPDKRPPAKCASCGKLTNSVAPSDDYRCSYCRELARRYEAAKPADKPADT